MNIMELKSSVVKYEESSGSQQKARFSNSITNRKRKFHTYASSIPVRMMDESIEIIFMTMLRQNDVAEAIEFINSVDYHYIPHEQIVQTIIFEVLLKCEDVRTVVGAKVYLMNILNFYPPDDEKRRKFYYNVLRDNRGVNSDLWPMFCTIVNSCFCNYGIYKANEESNQQNIRIPNCYESLHFYTEIFSRDFEYLTSEKGVSSTYKDLLIVKLLWPCSNIGAKNHVDILLKWINDVYSAPNVQKKNEIMNCLHKLLDLMVKCVVSVKHELSDIAAVNSSCLAEIVDDIMNKCKDTYNTITNAKLFMISLSMKYFKLKVCEKIVEKMICQPTQTFNILTLRNIVNYCMFKTKRGRRLGGKISSLKQKQVERTAVKRLVKPRKGDTVLHECAKLNKFADLLQELNEDVNSKNECGYTPLHEACIANSLMCAHVLLTETGKGNIPEIDLTSTSKEGLTALHYAVNANAIDIVKILLELGGAHLLNAVDLKGRKPTHYSVSLEMNSLLTKYADAAGEQSNGTEKTDNNTVYEVPSLQSYKDCGIYLHALKCLLATYTSVFHLYDLIFCKSPNIRSHEDQRCFHYENSTKSESAACSDDVSLMKEMPYLLDKFLECIKKETSKKNLQMNIELIPLEGYAASLM